MLMAGLLGRRKASIGALALVTVLLSAVAVASAQLPFMQNAPSADYCATMPDSIGLYAGNPVTQMGYQIGKVTKITPDATDVQVNFTVTERRPLPRDVKAIIRSNSILADRSLELVGNYKSGPQLPVGGCIPLGRSATPKSLSQVIGSANNFIKAINPEGSTNIGDIVKRLDQATHGYGPGVNQLLTTSARVLDSPDQGVSDIGSIITNLAQLTSVLKDLRAPLKEILLDAESTTPDVQLVSDGAWRITRTALGLLNVVSDLEINLGQEFQFTLDSAGVALRKVSAHAPRLSNLLNPVPWWINTLANHYNNRPFPVLRYRPPLYRIRTPDGVALCNIMNAQMPGSCANVQGTPYAVDVALLQYVMSQAARR